MCSKAYINDQYIKTFYHSKREKMVFNPSEVTKNGYTYRLNSDLHCSKILIDNIPYYDLTTCVINTYPNIIFTITGFITTIYYCVFSIMIVIGILSIFTSFNTYNYNYPINTRNKINKR